MSRRVSIPEHVTFSDDGKRSVLSSTHDTLISTPATSPRSPSRSQREPVDKATGYTSYRLTAAALTAQNADAAALNQYWESEEEKRVERLIKASRELGFELPRQCY